ncbi:MAG: DNA polymerase III subunit delta [Chloroflexi bacterium]|nr:DNA polymerase III subunit delta [Chloroflexota bacterium]
MFYLFYGDDTVSRRHFLDGLIARMGDPAMADLNTSHLDGQTVRISQVIDVCNTMPFASDRRLVIVEGLLTHLRSQRPRTKKSTSGEKHDPEGQLLRYLKGGLPETTRLIFLEPGTLEKKSPLAQSPITKLAKKRYPNHVKGFIQPKGRDLTDRILQTVRKNDGAIDHQAATELASLCGADWQRTENEIEKLLLYVHGERPISTQDIRDLVDDARQTSIFDLVDAVGLRRRDAARRLMHKLVTEEAAPPYLIAMVTRQIRTMLKIKVLIQRRLPPDKIAGRLGLHPYVAKKGVGQCQNFSRGQLRRAIRNLFRVDLAIKTGEVDPIMALDLLIDALCDDGAVMLPGPAMPSLVADHGELAHRVVPGG